MGLAAGRYSTVCQSRARRSVPFFFVEALAGFVAKPAALEHGFYKGREFYGFACAGLAKICHHVSEHIETHHVCQAERPGAGPAEDASGKQVDILHSEVLFLHERQGLQHDVDAEAIGDEVRRVVRVDNGFAQAAVSEVGDGGDRGGVGLRRGNNLEQPHVTRRIEKMRPEPGGAQRGGQSLGDAGHGQSAGVGGEDGPLLEVRQNFGQDLLLDGQIFGDRFDDPVAALQQGEVVVEGSGLDEAAAGSIVESCGLGFAESVKRGFRDHSRAGQVEQNDGNSGVGQVGGDADAHSACAQDCSPLDQAGTERAGRRGGRCHGCRGGLAHASTVRFSRGERKTVKVNKG